MLLPKCKKACRKCYYDSIFVFFRKENVCTFASLTVRLSEPRDHDRRRRCRQHPLTAAMVDSLPPRRVKSVDDMHKHKLSRVDSQKRQFACVLRLCMASRAHAVESRHEGLQNDSRRSRRLWRLRVRSPRILLVVLNYSYTKRWPQLQH